MGKRISDLKEKILTVGIFAGLFLPARLFFYTYVSQYWLGSFGVMTAILLGTLYLSKKNKLGYAGYLIQKHTQSFARGRFGKLSLAYLIFSIYLFSNFIYGVENPPEIKPVVRQQLADAGVTDMKTATTQADKLHWDGPAAAYGIFFSFLILLVPTNLGYSMFGIMNDFSHGWMLHFATVGLIGELEAIGLVLYFRYFYKVAPETTTEP